MIALLLGSCCLFPVDSWCTEPCRAEGACRVRTERAGDGLYRCYADSDEACAASEGCTRSGRCAVAEDGSCVRPEDVSGRACAVSLACAVRGACHPRDGFCEARTDADCERSLECRTEGRCTRDATGLCKATDEAQCTSSTRCTLDGRCELLPPFLGGFATCGLSEDGDCTPSVGCERYGRCEPRPPEGCTEGCRVFGCGRPGERAPQPCADPDVCMPDGRCIRDADGVCVRVP